MAALLAVCASVASSVPRARQRRSHAPKVDTAIAQTCPRATRVCAALAVPFASLDRRNRHRVAPAATHRTRAWACVCCVHRAGTKTRATPVLVSAASLVTSVRLAAVSSCLPPAHRGHMGTPLTPMATRIASTAHQASRALAVHLSRSRAVQAPLRVYLGWPHASHALLALFSRSERQPAATNVSLARFASRAALRRCRARVAPTQTQPTLLAGQSADRAQSGTHVVRAASRRHRAVQAHTPHLRASLHV